MADSEVRDDEALLDECGASPALSMAPDAGGGDAEPGPRRVPMWLSNILVLAVATALILGGVWLTGSWRAQGPTAEASGQGDGGVTMLSTDAPGAAPQVGQEAPAFSATDINGRPVDLTELRGRPVWLLFGATWCAECRTEALDIQAISEEYAERLTVVAVHVQDSPRTVADYVQRLGLTHPTVVDSDDTISSAYGVYGIPSHWFIDANGTIAATRVGAMSPAQMREQVQALTG
ncbi:redoxin [Actinomyces sp. Chiba101]|uniref:Peroxiredoxin n=1 Tax=Actinomyces denticolens TaxID=52767 RepID=A0ABY1I959_9ACTO|nr:MULTISPECIES: TlpA disulfide reductase family protein [Actinomyces]BAW93385.1 redoxin [Actinomyces sp. Chiba101]SHI70770.1 Peroxiredoxin [Actinomyces denticolens]SUU03320.1 Thiol-disulfide oxidoreductase resA [Actinomyces denticolens]